MFVQTLKRRASKRTERKVGRRSKISNEYDLSGLVEKLKALEPQFRKVGRSTPEESYRSFGHDAERSAFTGKLCFREY
jgi:hypothetical protein